MSAAAGSDPRSRLDLDVLRRAPPSEVAARRPWFPRLLLGLLAAGALLALYGAFLQPVLFPPRDVRLAPVRAVAGDAVRAPQALAQAAGWLEPDPYPTTLRPRVAGVVARLDVVEGQRVSKDETVIAVLENPELDVRLQLAEAAVGVRAARLALAGARRDRARALLSQRIELRAAALAARTEVLRDREGLAEARAALAAAQAARERARVELEAQEALRGSGGTPPISVRLAEAALRGAEADVRMREAAAERARAELAQDEQAHALAVEALEAPRALEGDLAVAEQEHAEAEAELRAARAEVDAARSLVALLTVRSPVDGVVQRLVAAVGAPAGPMGEPRESTTVGPGASSALDVSLGALALVYDPARLQARVEVPLADVGALSAGTEAALEVESVPGRVFRGTVQRLLHEANVQNNKLWVKVRLLETDPLLRPEMLCRARFLARAPEGGAAPADGRPRLAVPEAAIAGDGLFVLDPRGGGRARRVAVQRQAPAGPDGWVEVTGELGLSNEVILEPAGLVDGERVRGAR